VSFDLSRLNPSPVGFGKCDRCAYRDTSGTVAICHSCAMREIEPLPEDGCQVCQLPLQGDQCGNPICNDRPTRHFDRNRAIGYRKGYLDSTISWYKNANQPYWAVIFARLLLAFLDEHRENFSEFDLIVASPTYVSTKGPGRRWDHTRLVLRQAYLMAEGRWPFDVEKVPAVRKTKHTRKMTGQPWKVREAIADEEVWPALEVPDPSRTRDKAILVYEDIFTDGLTINQVARCVKEEGGADRVSSITLARQPWTRKGPEPLTS